MLKPAFSAGWVCCQGLGRISAGSRQTLLSDPVRRRTGSGASGVRSRPSTDGIWSNWRRSGYLRDPLSVGAWGCRGFCHNGLRLSPPLLCCFAGFVGFVTLLRCFAGFVGFVTLLASLLCFVVLLRCFAGFVALFVALLALLLASRLRMHQHQNTHVRSHKHTSPHDHFATERFESN